MHKPLVSIITINYNQVTLTCDLLASLRQVTYPSFEIIVVDNASPTEDPGCIALSFPEVTLVRSRKNLGFAGGNNLGLREAKGEYILFLNNDTEVAPDFIEPLVQVFQKDPSAGIASPKIIYYGTDNIIQYAGSSGINPRTGRSITIGNAEKDQGQHNVSGTTALADGAAMMVPRKVIQEVGVMPELYFIYYEELDWCEMIKRAGFTCQYVANSTVYHKESMTVGKTSVMKTYYMNRNRLLFIRRNITGGAKITSMLVFLLAAWPKKALGHVMRLEGKHLWALVRGIGWHMQHMRLQEVPSSLQQPAT